MSQIYLTHWLSSYSLWELFLARHSSLQHVVQTHLKTLLLYTKWITKTRQPDTELPHMIKAKCWSRGHSCQTELAVFKFAVWPCGKRNLRGWLGSSQVAGWRVLHDANSLQVSFMLISVEGVHPLYLIFSTSSPKDLNQVRTFSCKTCSSNF